MDWKSSSFDVWSEHDDDEGGEAPPPFEATAAAAAAAYMAYPEEPVFPVDPYGYPELDPFVDPVLKPCPWCAIPASGQAVKLLANPALGTFAAQLL